MFFSIVIPTYNPKKFLPDLLSSIRTNDCKDQIEIIISDDCSNEPFSEVIERFKDLNIKLITNDHHYGFPRTGRENGLNTATGKWITFIDQDDIFVDHALDSVKEAIEVKEMHNVLYCDFYIKDPERSKELTVKSGMFGWTHGKFFEKEFLTKYQIHYDEVQYGEDINFCTKVQCVLTENRCLVNRIDVPVYVWQKSKDSLSSGDYLLYSMKDYVQSTFGVEVSYLEKHQPEDDCYNDFVYMCLCNILHVYFYTQHGLFWTNKRMLAEIIACLSVYVERFKKHLNCTTIDIIDTILSDYNTYNTIRQTDNAQIEFIEQISFPNWMALYF